MKGEAIYSKTNGRFGEIIKIKFSNKDEVFISNKGLIIRCPITKKMREEVKNNNKLALGLNPAQLDIVYQAIVHFKRRKAITGLKDVWSYLKEICKG